MNYLKKGNRKSHVNKYMALKERNKLVETLPSQIYNKMELYAIKHFKEKDFIFETIRRSRRNCVKDFSLSKNQEWEILREQEGFKCIKFKTIINEYTQKQNRRAIAKSFKQLRNNI